VCPPGHPLANLPVAAPEDLAGERLVAFDEGLTIRKEIDRYLRRRRVDVKVTIAFDNVETIKRAVEIGEGISILPFPTMSKDLQAGTLAAIELAPPLVRTLGIIHRKSGLLSRTVQRFIEFIRKSGNAEALEVGEAAPSELAEDAVDDVDAVAAKGRM
jgi:DNA-binding transcriptional LysR family regulator